MIKATVLTTLIAGLAMGANLASGARPQEGLKERDTELIIEVDRSLETLTQEGVKNTQAALQNRIAQYVTPHFAVLDSFSILANAFSLRINSKYIDSIKQDIIKQNILQTPADNFNVPQTMLHYMTKINNQKRIFKYITLNMQNLSIDRKITEDEIEQYYQDFNRGRAEHDISSVAIHKKT